ncbi:ABC transporter substrate-binding protein [Phaeobacter gallaeciensis]|uniref:ABC-type Fe3+-hydroxamate transport system, periplasmic component n=1 Tax=Phaeobacter gallaeciensis TaxID=60890 RepID=A0AAD0EER2_9RHOB|nr:ABC transporter substrate-binding protein [Phaeobacter gallaeciensis]AHD11556.1 ABC-type Fe3+-hydroxamate transport system, periplasmic component [Phaeobacter gallaeciensis DSM 26640]ATE94820.1 ABC-type Fe3+-hydroxamate transport system, periplasmic component [Phaeobacter gallaeciensis]ATE99092.1 ABC-type Fe3+-hydroxamate transport system, periplasmic component [Phaeobacter gallaeciensis]ATF03484.1 ABC-type Fe3+-hydroxamate transport system, periplasmic component [Phaeobacter gallaeciensis]
MNTRFISGFALTLAATVTFLTPATSAKAEAVTLTDIAGRQVTLEEYPEKIILGEGRMMYAIAAITDGNPFEHIVGWKDDLVQYDPDAFRKFEAVFPQDTQRMINFGNPYAGDFSIEAVLEADADLVLLDSGNLFKAEETGLIDKLDKAGVPVVFIDFRRNATENTVPSLLILGRILGEEKGAAKFIDFYISEMKKVSNVVDQIPAEERPLVVLENAAGWQPDFCCWSFGPYNYGRFVELAGGMNYASTLENAYSVSLSMEGVIDADPDHVIGTGANWAEAKPEVTSTLLGYEGDPAVNAEKIAALAARPGFAELRAVKNGNYHSIYHQFYNSPYHFVAIQQIAKWLYPEDFEDLDPQDTLDRLHAEFMPYEASGQFWLSADK